MPFARPSLLLIRRPAGIGFRQRICLFDSFVAITQDQMANLFFSFPFFPRRGGCGAEFSQHSRGKEPRNLE